MTVEKKRKITQQEYENIKENIRQAQKTLKHCINQTELTRKNIKKRLAKLEANPDQKKEFKLKVALEQLKITEKSTINKLVEKIVEYEQELIIAENYLNIKNPIAVLKPNYKSKKEKIPFSLKKYFQVTNWKNYGYIFLAALIATIAFDYFFSPSRILPPGIGALGRIFAQFIFPPLSIDNINNSNLLYYIFFIVLNIPLIIFSWKVLGVSFTLKSLMYMIGQILFHIIINGIGSYHGIPYLNSNDFYFLQNLNTIKDQTILDLWIFFFGLIGAILTGIAYGMLYKVGSCPGGTDFINNYIARKKEKPIGNISILVNSIILLGSWAISYGIKSNTPNPSFGLYYFSAPLFASFMVIFITGLVANKIFPRYRNTTLFIISEKPILVSDRLKTKGIHNQCAWKVDWTFDDNIRDDSILIMITIPLVFFREIKETVLLADPGAIIRSQSAYKIGEMPRDKK
ncbi:YitT family protein [Spiroplasma chrysopicola]|uniref:YitT family protein n=1 Tax=Spiroplasma chrysopicola TaxID=216933 RepID=UPI001F182DF1|nr:YitT family protein [Spiroplasma chrysopicola]